jgi:hypothetical protein
MWGGSNTSAANFIEHSNDVCYRIVEKNMQFFLRFFVECKNNAATAWNMYLVFGFMPITK